MRAPGVARAGIRWLGALLLVASTVSQGIALAPLSCPPGTKLEKRQQANSPVIELCRDLKTGFLEGPYREIEGSRVVLDGNYHADQLHGEVRLFDEQGRPKIIDEYSNGKKVRSRLTPVGREAMFRELNEEAGKMGQKRLWVVRDERTVELIVATPARFSQPDQDEKAMRQHLVSRTNFCNQLFAKDADLQTIIARYVDDAGKDLLVVPVRRADCGK